MPVPRQLIDKISEYEKAGYLATEIVQGLQESENFPDIALKVKQYGSQGYSPDEILSGLKTSRVNETQRSGPLGQFQRVGDIYQEEVQSGMRGMKQFAEKPTGKAAIGAVLGGLQYVAAPLTAVAKGAFGEPTQQLAEDIGIPKQINVPVVSKVLGPMPATKLIGETAEQGAYMLPYGQMVREAIKGGEVLRVAREAEKAGAQVVGKITAKEIPKTKPPLEYPSMPKQALIEEQYAVGKLVKPVVQESLQKQVADAAIEAIAKSPPEEKRRVGQQVIDLVHSQEINWKELPGILQKYEITPEEFAQRLKDTYSTAGRTLQKLSFVAKQVRKQLADNPEAQKFLDKFVKEIPEPTDLDKFLNFFRSIESTRRGLLVSQLATAMRNATSQAARVTIGAMDDALQGVIRGTVGGQGNIAKQVGEGLDLGIAFLHRFSPSARKNLTNILESENALFAKTRLLSAPVHEITIGGKITKVLNSANTVQEYFFRKIAFEAKLTQLAERAGMDIKSIDPKKLSKEMLGEAAQYGLEMTFSAMPKSDFGKRFVKDLASQPIFTALLNPFPRFAFGNALPYIWNFSPVSFMKALNPKIVAELASGNPQKFADAASKATLGSLQLGLGLWLRNSEHRGEKWYEVKIGEKYYDTRSYAPLLSPYMLIAEGMSHPDRLKPADWAGAIIGLNRVAGTGLVLTDVLRSKGIENTAEIVSNVAGAYLGSFSVPARTFQDLYAKVSPKAATMRDVREQPVTGPFKRNVPGLSETLPEAVSPMKREPPKAESPLLRQLTGLSERTKTIIEKEVDDLQIEYPAIYPRTGIPRADREMSKYMGPVIEDLAPRIILNPKYENLEEPAKRLVIQELFREAKAAAREKLKQTNPTLWRQIKYEGMNVNIKELLESKGLKLK